MATRVRILKTIFKIRRGTEDKWISINPFLEEGEPAFSIDVNRLKIGDGIHHWNDLEYLNENETKSILERLELLESIDIIDCGSSTTLV